MKKKLLYAVVTAVLVSISFFAGRTSRVDSVSATSEMITPEVTSDDPPYLPWEVTNEECDDISPTLVKNIIYYNCTTKDIAIEAFSYSEGEEPDSITFNVLKKSGDDFETVSVTIPNEAPNIYVWTGEEWLQAEAENKICYKAGTDGKRLETHNWVFITQDGTEYSFNYEHSDDF